MKRIRFFHRNPGDPSQVTTLGDAVEGPLGWRFHPVPGFGHGKSRRWHETWEACLPKWLAYPDGCESRRID